MATAFKRKELRPIPEGATIITYRGRPYATWTDAKGKAQRAPLNRGGPRNKAGTRVVQEAEFYTVEYFDHTGKRRRVPSRTPDKDAALQLGHELETAAMRRRNGIIDPTQERFAKEAARPLVEHVTEYEAALTARGREARYVAENCGRLRRLLELCKTAGIRDLTPAGVQVALQTIGDDGAGLETLNTYLRSVKSFSRWLWREQRTPVDALAVLSKYNAETDRRHVRRELTPEESVYLLAHVEQDSNPAFNLAGPDRAMVYRLALNTGFRAGELRSLTPASFDLDADPPTVAVAAAYSKRRRQDLQPIRPDMAELLRPWLAGRPDGVPVFGRLPDSTARMLRKDLAAARRKWLDDETLSDAERDARQRSDFLQYKNAAGEVVDFHATRHTYISGIVAGGKASVKTCQELARHSTPTLTIGRYAHARLHDLTAALDALPDLTTPPVTTATPQAMTATGTDGLPPVGAERLCGSKCGSSRAAKPCVQVAERGGPQQTGGQEETGDGDSPQVLAMADFGDEKSHVAERGLEAEGTGVEPATPYGAPHLQDGANPRKTRRKAGVSQGMGANAGAVETKTEHFAPDLQAIIDAWPNLSQAVRDAIELMVEAARGGNG